MGVGVEYHKSARDSLNAPSLVVWIGGIRVWGQKTLQGFIRIFNAYPCSPGEVLDCRKMRVTRFIHRGQERDPDDSRVAGLQPNRRIKNLREKSVVHLKLYVTEYALRCQEEIFACLMVV